MGVINGFVDGTNSGASPRKVPATAPEAFRIFKSLRFAGRQFFLGGPPFFSGGGGAAAAVVVEAAAPSLKAWKKSGNRISR